MKPLVCYGLRSHHSFTKANGAKIQRCWAHLLKEAKKLGEKYAEARLRRVCIESTIDSRKLLRKSLAGRKSEAGEEREAGDETFDEQAVQEGQDAKVRREDSKGGILSGSLS